MTLKEIKQVKIIMIEDDHGHAGLIRSNLEDSGVENEIIHFDNGKEALDAIKQNNNGIRPSHIIILLDLNLPGMDGYQVLQHLRSQEETKITPVFILTTTDNENEITKCHELGCNAYITKPVEYNDFQNAIKSLGDIFSIFKIPETL